MPATISRPNFALVALCLLSGIAKAMVFPPLPGRFAARRAAQRGGVLKMRLHRRVRADAPAKGAEEAPVGPLSLLQTSQTTDASSAAGSPVVDVFGTISVGTPPQELTVAIDTSSANLLVTSSLCRSVGCLAHRAYDASSSSTAQDYFVPNVPAGSDGRQLIALGMATGTADGEPLRDVVCLGPSSSGICTNTSFLQMTRMDQEPFNVFPYDGILGVGMPAGSLDMSFNFLGNLAEAGRLKRNRFSLWLATEADHGEDSEITFGDLDENRLGSEILWMPTVLRPGDADNTGLWAANLTDVYAGTSGLKLCGSTGCRAAFDTGTSVIGGPESFIQGIIQAVALQEDCSNYNELPMIGFQFRMYTLMLERGDYVKRVGSKCYHQFLAIEVPPPKGPVVLLGDPFLRRYMTIYDRDSLQIGLSFAKHQPVLGATDVQHNSSQMMVYNP